MARSRIRSAVRERRRVTLFWSGRGEDVADPDVPAMVDVRDALRALPFRKRVRVVLRHAFCLSEKDTAQALGVLVGTVKSQTSKGMAELQRRSCTLQNVWWEDVGEDAATFKGTSPGSTYAVQGGGARKADDKVFQFNGAGKLVVNKFQVSDFGKLVRTCGNCSKQYQRDVIINDTDISAPGTSIVGINTNYGETAALRSIRIHGDGNKKIKTCLRFTGNNTGAEPVRTGSGPDGTYCKFTSSDITYK
ncbi:pectate lyase [Streptomyces alboniger]|uniref:Pectate lyase n=1 Tax=Streptomyces alboniger TaxID=132473 RepID=A0A5J6HX28_STRAD|nr:pectate lyase [Streptomyces alboniger]QEV21215.1 hypothetical protein CP975_30015 [Streptomyces alboniger]